MISSQRLLERTETLPIRDLTNEVDTLLEDPTEESLRLLADRGVKERLSTLPRFPIGVPVSPRVTEETSINRLRMLFDQDSDGLAKQTARVLAEWGDSQSVLILEEEVGKRAQTALGPYMTSAVSIIGGQESTEALISILESSGSEPVRISSMKGLRKLLEGGRIEDTEIPPVAASPALAIDRRAWADIYTRMREPILAIALNPLERDRTASEAVETISLLDTINEAATSNWRKRVNQIRARVKRGGRSYGLARSVLGLRHDH